MVTLEDLEKRVATAFPDDSNELSLARSLVLALREQRVLIDELAAAIRQWLPATLQPPDARIAGLRAETHGEKSEGDNVTEFLRRTCLERGEEIERLREELCESRKMIRELDTIIHEQTKNLQAINRELFGPNNGDKDDILDAIKTMRSALHDANSRAGFAEHQLRSGSYMSKEHIKASEERIKVLETALEFYAHEDAWREIGLGELKPWERARVAIAKGGK